MPNVALDILVIVVKTKILLIFILLSSLVFIFVLVLVSSTIIQNVFVIFVIVFVVDEKKHCLEVWGSVMSSRGVVRGGAPAASDFFVYTDKISASYSLTAATDTTSGSSSAWNKDHATCTVLSEI